MLIRFMVPVAWTSFSDWKRESYPPGSRKTKYKYFAINIKTKAKKYGKAADAVLAKQGKAKKAVANPGKATSRSLPAESLTVKKLASAVAPMMSNITPGVDEKLISFVTEASKALVAKEFREFADAIGVSVSGTKASMLKQVVDTINRRSISATQTNFGNKIIDYAAKPKEVVKSKKPLDGESIKDILDHVSGAGKDKDDYWGNDAKQPFYRPGPNPTVDNVITRDGPNGLEVLMIRRKEGKAEGGKWALPGGFHDPDPRSKKGDPWKEGKESARGAAIRELMEETGLDLKDIESNLQDVGTYETGPKAKKKRDPRDNNEAWSKSTAFRLHLSGDHANKPVEGNDDADRATWTPVSQLEKMKLAFDHGKILKDAGVLGGKKMTVNLKAKKVDLSHEIKSLKDMLSNTHKVSYEDLHKKADELTAKLTTSQLNQLSADVFGLDEPLKKTKAGWNAAIRNWMSGFKNRTDAEVSSYKYDKRAVDDVAKRISSSNFDDVKSQLNGMSHHEVSQVAKQLGLGDIKDHKDGIIAKIAGKGKKESIQEPANHLEGNIQKIESSKPQPKKEEPSQPALKQFDPDWNEFLFGDRDKADPQGAPVLPKPEKKPDVNDPDWDDLMGGHDPDAPVLTKDDKAKADQAAKEREDLRKRIHEASVKMPNDPKKIEAHVEKVAEKVKEALKDPEVAQVAKQFEEQHGPSTFAKIKEFAKSISESIAGKAAGGVGKLALGIAEHAVRLVGGAMAFALFPLGAAGVMASPFAVAFNAPHLGGGGIAAAMLGSVAVAVAGLRVNDWLWRPYKDFLKKNEKAIEDLQWKFSEEPQYKLPLDKIKAFANELVLDLLMKAKTFKPGVA